MSPIISIRDRQTLQEMLRTAEEQVSALRAALGIPQDTSGKDLWLMAFGKYTKADQLKSAWITEGTDRKIDCIKAIRERTLMGLKEAKELVESAPCRLGRYSENDSMVLELRAQGCVLEWK